MPAPSGDPAPGDCDSREFQPPAVELGGMGEEFAGKTGGVASVLECSSPSSHSTLSVDAGSEQRDQEDETKQRIPVKDREQSSGFERKDARSLVYAPKNLRKLSKRVAGRRTAPPPPPPKRQRPTDREVEDFLSEIEASIDKKQHKAFRERYNFDVIEERPLPGRFEWVKLDQGQEVRGA